MKINLISSVESISIGQSQLNEGDSVQLINMDFVPKEYIIDSEEKINKLLQFEFSSVFFYKLIDYGVQIIQPANGVLIESNFIIDQIYKSDSREYYAVAGQLVINLNKGFECGEIAIRNKGYMIDNIQTLYDLELIKELYDIFDIKNNLGITDTSLESDPYRDYLLFRQKKWRIKKINFFTGDL